MAIFANKRVTVSTSKKGVRVSPKATTKAKKSTKATKSRKKRQ